MPLIEPSKYVTPPFYLINGHFETIIPSIFNKVEDVFYQRERMELSDSDFLELDWLKNDNNRLVILSHGMEGNSDRHYMKRSAKFYYERSWDVLAWNNRGCGGAINRLVKSAHHGTTEELSAVIDHALATKRYQTVVLIGFSMGGSMVSKYLSITPNLDERIKGGVTFSVSCDLHETVLRLEQTISIYRKKFLRKLKYKLQLKQQIHNELKAINIDSISNFEEYHEAFTIPFNGYADLAEFYKDASCIHYIPNLQKPLLMVNALNDPLLGANCYPTSIANSHKHLFLETPHRGGHLGFTLKNAPYSYMELSAMSFIDNHLV